MICHRRASVAAHSLTQETFKDFGGFDSHTESVVAAHLWLNAVIATLTYFTLLTSDKWESCVESVYCEKPIILSAVTEANTPVSRSHINENIIISSNIYAISSAANAFECAEPQV